MRAAGIAVWRRLAIVGALASLIAAMGAFVPQPAGAASVIEAQYAATGPWAVSTANVSDGAGSYVLYYPTNLGQGDVDHPIVTWGNGTNAAPSNYAGLLQHLASWGFAVVASTSGTTGSGTEVLAGANYLVTKNGDPASIFNGKLDTTKVAAAGHSQGASGAANATVLSSGLIKSTVTFNLPNPSWVSAEHVTNWSQITKPFLLLTGANDWLISSASGQTGYYNQITGPAAKASLKGAGHNTVQGNGGGFRGYFTAWLLYTLKGDTTARAAFVGSPPELNTNTNWSNQAEKNLP
jgi:pimeloyl-ACP methyl ester carboxylesterase